MKKGILGNTGRWKVYNTSVSKCIPYLRMLDILLEISIPVIDEVGRLTIDPRQDASSN